ncbi:MAG: hypothetical protein KJ676_09490 [Alphaproteobacteria bacterium]|nr:hypothetical protein [Alphaproteobacteria bacterium]MBU1525283.1 hypothetical protein [Alphaproteobacteria bacterium]MBU2118696.1 hypothetical protein [Alphaproteobacteria bacterium]MBU2352584.1 hypothetical protein [Alphaproteobacteria bacterium]MBU2382284.1 hypothetical protein [Alphaproteobacteria bacterium]
MQRRYLLIPIALVGAALVLAAGPPPGMAYLPFAGPSLAVWSSAKAGLAHAVAVGHVLQVALVAVAAGLHALSVYRHREPGVAMTRETKVLIGIYLSIMVIGGVECAAKVPGFGATQIAHV